MGWGGVSTTPCPLPSYDKRRIRGKLGSRPLGGDGSWAGETLVTLSGHIEVAVAQGHIIHPSPWLSRVIQVHQTDKLQL